MKPRSVKGRFVFPSNEDCFKLKTIFFYTFPAAYYLPIMKVITANGVLFSCNDSWSALFFMNYFISQLHIINLYICEFEVLII